MVVLSSIYIIVCIMSDMSQTLDPRREHLLECIQNDYKEGNEAKLIKYVSRLLSTVKNIDQERVWLANLKILSELGIKYETALAGYMELRDPR